MPSALFAPLPLSNSSRAIPAFVYGTAWKKEKTADLVYQALCNGFSAIDTAAQPKHYREDLVGEGIRRAVAEGRVKGGREGLYIQTKYTPFSAHDPNNLPYDPTLSIPDQVHTSIASSLHNLRLPPTTTPQPPTPTPIPPIDTLIIHTPLPTLPETLSAWRAAESHVPHEIQHLGISNTSLATLSALYSQARIKPAVVQNRFHAPTQYDGPLRRFCAAHGILYQAFWTLTANPRLVAEEAVVGELARKVGVEREQALYGLVLGLEDVVVLNGTKSEERMAGDWDAVGRLRDWAVSNRGEWEEMVGKFRGLVEVDGAGEG